ncbi:hypothetical protein [Sphingosinithalassobacter portus]|uniref:hypothetical protein n=1 Tax=Stakelama portus TaxID=2676234 RepID=UPI000D6E0CA4|nr:hypothetical protein [Sphingosinithalassobacter portus]
MSGVTIIGALLNASTAVTAKVPSARIKAGQLPDGVALPALLVRGVSLIERKELKRGAIVRVTERVSVTVRADSYRDQRAIIAEGLVRNACAGFVGDLASFSRVSVTDGGCGPDLIGPANSFEQTQDFRVSFETSGS